MKPNRLTAKIAQLAVELVVAVSVAVVLFPFLWIFLASLKPPHLVSEPDVWVFTPSLANWIEVVAGSEVPRNVTTASSYPYRPC